MPGIRYFFYITNDRATCAQDIVFLANERCEQENLIEQLKNGCKALRMPVDNLVSNWAYMVMGALAWTLKAWFALSLPVSKGRWAQRQRSQKHEVLRMEFKRFVNAFVRVPCQIVRGGRQIVYRLLSWNPWGRTKIPAATTAAGMVNQRGSADSPSALRICESIHWVRADARSYPAASGILEGRRG